MQTHTLYSQQHARVPTGRIYTYIYMYIHTCIYIYIYIHTHTRYSQPHACVPMGCVRSQSAACSRGQFSQKKSLLRNLPSIMDTEDWPFLAEFFFWKKCWGMSTRHRVKDLMARWSSAGGRLKLATKICDNLNKNSSHTMHNLPPAMMFVYWSCWAYGGGVK